MTPEQELQTKLDKLMSEVITLIMMAEDENKIPPYLTFHIAPDGCKITKEWGEVENQLKKIEPTLIFDNTLPNTNTFCPWIRMLFEKTTR